MGHRKAQHVREKLVTQPAQHALTDDASVYIDRELETAVDQNQYEKQSAQRHQVWDLVELEAKQHARKIGTGNRLVDDDLRQIQRDVKKRKGEDGEHQQQQLLSGTVAQDELPDGGRHGSVAYSELVTDRDGQIEIGSQATLAV